MKRWFLIIMCGITALVAAQRDTAGSGDYSAFAKANKAYTNENYDLAIAAYKQILKGGVHSAELYFNLGNAFYKKNEVGESIYYFEKALQLDPDDEDIQNNLRFAQQMRIDAIQALPENSVGSSVDRLANSLSVDEWAYVSLVLALITILLIILYVYAATPAKKRLLFILGFIGLIFLVLSILLAIYAKNHLDKQQFAIVMVDEVTGREAPKQNSNSVFTIHEGTKIEVLENFEQWSRVALENGNKAWLPRDAFKEL